MTSAAHSRLLLHADMDAFYASVEQRDFPELQGLPVVVGATGKRGVVAAASYEARQFGIRSAMPMRDALRRCPDLICRKSRMAEYQAASRQIFEIFYSFTPLVEGLSLDEAYLDIGASMALFGTARDIGTELKRRVRVASGLTVSVGIAPNRLVAKIASDLGKPDGLVLIEADQIVHTLDPLPVRVLPGIGRTTLRRLSRAGIRRVADLRLAPGAVLESVFGKHAERMRSRASGVDARTVGSEHADKSISAEETFANDSSDPRVLERELLRLSEKTAMRLRARRLTARTVQLKIRRADFRTFTRQTRLSPASSETGAIYQASRRLLAAWRAENDGVRLRLLGVGLSGLAAADQADLFDSSLQSHGGALDRTVDSIRDRFGALALTRARSLPRDKG